MRLSHAGLSLLVSVSLAAGCSSSSSSGASSPDGGPWGDGGESSSAQGAQTSGHASPGNQASTGKASSGCHGCSANSGGSPAGSSAASGPGIDAGTLKPLTAGHTTQVPLAVTTANGTVTRTYDITLPASCDPSHPLPVIFSFHGDGGTGADMYASFPIEAVVAAAGAQAIFVYPNGTDDNVDPGGADRAWDLYHDPGPFPYAYSPGQPVPAESDEPSGNVDVDFFDAMVATFEASYCVDPSRVFITGMSSGGYLANQFARWRSGLIKGTAPQSGGVAFGNNDSGDGTWSPPNYCIASTGAVPTLIVHGLADGTVDPCNALEAQSYWELTNGCAASSGNCTLNDDSCTGTKLADPSTAPTTLSSLNGLCLASTGCTSPVVLCEVPGLGHDIWSDAPQVIWSFFASL